LAVDTVPQATAVPSRGLLAFAVAHASLPRTAARAQRFDTLAALLTACTFGAALGAMASAAQRAATPRVLALVLAALACGAWLLRRQAGQPAPMLPVDLLRRPLFALSVATSMAAFAAQGLAFVSLPFFIETVLQRNPVQTASRSPPGRSSSPPVRRWPGGCPSAGRRG